MARQLGLLERAKLEQEFDQAKARARKLGVLHTIGTSIASALDLEQVLVRIVEAAVYITGAEEGSLLLLDEETQDLHLRAQKGLGDRYARGFRIRVDDSLAGEVLRSGSPKRLSGVERPVKVVTGYLVNSILYVPIAIKERSIGVLAVDNLTSQRPFSDDDENLLMVLAGYAAIALENTRQRQETELRFQALVAVHQGGQAEPGALLDAGVSGILLGKGGEAGEPGALTPRFVADTVGPCLAAIAELQRELDILEGRPPAEVRVLAITEGWPVPVSLQGAEQAVQALGETILPRQEAGERSRRANAIELALDLVVPRRPELREAELIGYVARLLPVVETLLDSSLQLASSWRSGAA